MVTRCMDGEIGHHKVTVNTLRLGLGLGYQTQRHCKDGEKARAMVRARIPDTRSLNGW